MNKTKWGTGVLIASDIVLTAAHNIYDYTKPARAKYPSIKFIPGANGKEAPFGEIDVEEVYAPETYIHHKDSALCSEDYALLFLKVAVGIETGFFGLHIASEELLKSRQISVVGYPGDKLADKEGMLEQWGEKTIVDSFDHKNEHISYHVNASLGQSGSGVIYEDDKGDFYVIGVHLNKGHHLSSACWLTKDRFDLIHKWTKYPRREKQEKILEALLSEIIDSEIQNGRDHPDTGIKLNNLGNAWGSIGNYERKKDLLTRALEIFEKHYGRYHPETGIALTYLGNAWGSLGDYEKRKDLLTQALEINEKHYGIDHPQTGITLTYLGNAWGSLGDYEKQKDLLTRAL